MKPLTPVTAGKPEKSESKTHRTVYPIPSGKCGQYRKRRRKLAFVKIDRKFFTCNRYWNQKREYSYAEAWIDLIQSARFEADPLRIVLPNGKTIKIERGEMHGSLRFLGNRWGWSKNKVSKFLNENIDDGAIALRSENGESIITLTNYEKYNHGTPNGTPDGTVVDTRNRRAKCGFLARDGTPDGTPKGQRRDSEGTNIEESKEFKEFEEGGEARVRAREAPPPVSRHHFDIFVAEWNALANDTTAGVKATPVNWLDPPDAVIRPYLDRCREYGVEIVHGAIGKLRNALFWQGKKIGIGSILDEQKFLKLISGEYDNIFTKSGDKTKEKPPNQSDENERVLRKQDEEYERLLASRAIGDIEKHPSNA